MDFDKLDARNFRRWTHFKEMKTEYALVLDAISINDTLKETYEIYQILLQDFKKKDVEGLKNTWKFSDLKIQSTLELLLKQCLRILIMLLILDYSYGFTEGINNFIKALKSLAFGYKSFFHFRNRILITLTEY